jgi:lipoate-protein ligase A
MSVPGSLEFVLQPSVDPRTASATDLMLMREAAAGRRGCVLHAYSLTGPVVSLGRYHVAPEASADDSVGLQRRVGGGRVLAAGDGFVGVTLIVPTPDALLGDAAAGFSAPQVMNRYVRGVMGGCRLLGVDPVYPGRDLLTLQRRRFAGLALEVDARGTTLFEVVIAVGRAMDALPDLLERADPEGIVAAAAVSAEEVTCLERELGALPALEEVAHAVAQGYETSFQAELGASTLTEAERAAVERLERENRAWLCQRVRRPELDHRGSALTQLGMLEVYFALRGGVLAEVLLSGDFIANSPHVERIEAALRGCPLQASAIDTAMAASCRPGDYLLGLGEAGLIRDTILRGTAW